MLRRLGWLVLSFVVLNTTGCALLQIAWLPIQLLINILGAIGSAAGSAVGIAATDPVQGPPALVRRLEESRFVVEGLRAEVPCSIVCSAPGHEPRVYSWPQDFADREPEIVVVLQPAR